MQGGLNALPDSTVVTWSLNGDNQKNILYIKYLLPIQLLTNRADVNSDLQDVYQQYPLRIRQSSDDNAVTQFIRLTCKIKSQISWLATYAKQDCVVADQQYKGILYKHATNTDYPRFIDALKEAINANNVIAQSAMSDTPFAYETLGSHSNVETATQTGH